MKDTRLYFIKEPILLLAVFIFFGGLITIVKHNKPKDKVKVEKTVTEVKSDTTEWRKQYYEHLYNSTK